MTLAPNPIFERIVRLSRNQLIGAITLLVLIWLVAVIRLIISRG